MDNLCRIVWKNEQGLRQDHYIFSFFMETGKGIKIAISH